MKDTINGRVLKTIDGNVSVSEYINERGMWVGLW